MSISSVFSYFTVNIPQLKIFNVFFTIINVFLDTYATIAVFYARYYPQGRACLL